MLFLKESLREVFCSSTRHYSFRTQFLIPARISVLISSLIIEDYIGRATMEASAWIMMAYQDLPSLYPGLWDFQACYVARIEGGLCQVSLRSFTLVPYEIIRELLSPCRPRGDRQLGI